MIEQEDKKKTEAHKERDGVKRADSGGEGGVGRNPRQTAVKGSRFDRRKRESTALLMRTCVCCVEFMRCIYILFF